MQDERVRAKYDGFVAIQSVRARIANYVFGVALYPVGRRSGTYFFQLAEDDPLRQLDIFDDDGMLQPGAVATLHEHKLWVNVYRGDERRVVQPGALAEMKERTFLVVGAARFGHMMQGHPPGGLPCSH